jgi:DNA-directed RNA polymerase subunit RPC12/RpoP
VAADFAVAAEDEEPSAHVCGVCGRSFPLLSSLSQHMRRHTREKPYKCPYCEHRTAQKGSLKAHVRSHKLGLLGRSPGPEGATTEGAPGCGEDASASAGEVADSSSEKEHGGVEGGAKKKKKVPKRKARRGDDDAEAAGEEESSGSSGGGGANAPEEGAGVGPFPCSVCSQVFPQAALLKAHAKKHKGAQDHGCRICGRRFRQAWFLQSHMRIHRATKAPLKGGGDGATQPATVNGAHRDPAALANEECLYELCAGCGNFFYDRRSLQAHEKLHKPGHGRGQAQTPPQQQQPDKPVDPEAVASKEDFLKSLNLRCVRSEEPAAEEKEPAGRIMELDPICSYQAWQIATKGRLVEPTLATVTIIDDDHAGIFTFSQRLLRVSESSGVVAVKVVRNSGSRGTVCVPYRTEDGTANAGSDYEFTEGVVVFKPGETLKEVRVGIIDDDIFEEDEHFFVRLSNLRVLETEDEVLSPNSLPYPMAMLGFPNVATVTILDDDHSGIFTFESGSVHVSESIGVMEVKVLRTSGARGTVVVPFRTMEGLAKGGGEDFEDTYGELEFKNDETW